MIKKLLCLVVMVLVITGLSGCNNDKEAAQKEAKMQQLLNQKTEKNVRHEKWKVVEIKPTSTVTKLVKIVNPETNETKTLEVEGNDDLKAGMDVIIEIRVTDLSMNKFSDDLKNREFIKILYY